MRHLVLAIAPLAALAAHAQLTGSGLAEAPTAARAPGVAGLMGGLAPPAVGPPTATGSDITFENNGLRLVIGPGGECKSLYDKTLMAERICQPGRPFMRAVSGGSDLPVTPASPGAMCSTSSSATMRPELSLKSRSTRTSSAS